MAFITDCAPPKSIFQNLLPRQNHRVSPGSEHSQRRYRGRLAPSPTGYLHLGHARTFWMAQQRAIEAADAVDFESFRAAYRRANMDTAMREAAQRVGQDAQDFVVSARAHDVTIEAVKRLLGA